MSRLAPEEQDAAGSPATPVLPSLPPSLTPHLLGLLYYLNSSNVTRNGASRKGKGQGHDAQNTHQALLVSHSVFAAFSSVFCKKKKKSPQRETLADSVNNF